jgi:hypothetical protein
MNLKLDDEKSAIMVCYKGHNIREYCLDNVQYKAQNIF